MFRGNLVQSLRVFKNRNAVVTLSLVNLFDSHLVRRFSSETLTNTTRTVSADGGGSGTSAHRFRDRSLLQTYQFKREKDNNMPRNEQLLSSFPLVEKIQRETDVDQLFELYEVLKHNSDNDNVAAISAEVALFSRFSRLRHVKEKGNNEITDYDLVDKAAEYLLDAIKLKSSHFETTQLASAVWAMATHRVRDKSFYVHFDKEIRRRDPREFTNGDLAMIMRAYGKANFRAFLLYKMLRDEIMARDLASFNVEDISKIVWSYAQRKQTSAMLFASIKKELLSRDLKNVPEITLVMILWSYAMVGVNTKDLFRNFKHEILQRGLSRFSDRQLAQIVTSYAEKNMHAPDLFEGIASDLLQRGELKFDSKGLAMLATSFAKTKNYTQDLFTAIGDRVMDSNLSAYQPREVVQLFWAFTEAGFLPEALHHKLTSQILLCDFPRLQDSALEMLVTTLENSHLKAPELVTATEAELVRRSEAKS